MNRVRFPSIKPVRGSVTLEAIIALTLFIMTVGAVVGLFLGQFGSAQSNNDMLRAIQLAEQGLEGARKIRNNSWFALTAGTHGLNTSGSAISFSGTEDTTDGLVRSVTVSNVDTNTKKITSTVSWAISPARNRSVTVETLLTDWRRVGASQLSGDWSRPTIVSAPIFARTESGAWGIDVRDGLIYLGLASDRDSSRADFYIIDATDPANPTTLSTLYTNPKGLNDLLVSENYVYAADRDNHFEMHIIEVSNPLAPRLISSFEIPDYENQTLTIAKKDQYVFLGTDQGPRTGEFHVIDVSDPALPRLVASLELDTAVNDIFIKDSIAYVALGFYMDTNLEIIMIDISSPENPTIIGRYDAPGREEGYGVSINDAGVTVLARRKGDLDQDPELITLDTSDPSQPLYLGGVDRNISFERIISQEYLVFSSLDKKKWVEIYNISDPATPTLFSTVNLADEGRGLAFEGNYLYVATGDSYYPLAIITSTPE